MTKEVSAQGSKTTHGPIEVAVCIVAFYALIFVLVVLEIQIQHVFGTLNGAEYTKQMNGLPEDMEKFVISTMVFYVIGRIGDAIMKCLAAAITAVVRTMGPS